MRTVSTTAPHLPLRRINIVFSVERLECLERDPLMGDGDPPGLEPANAKAKHHMSECQIQSKEKDVRCFHQLKARGDSPRGIEHAKDGTDEEKRSLHVFLYVGCSRSWIKRLTMTREKTSILSIGLANERSQAKGRQCTRKP